MERTDIEYPVLSRIPLPAYKPIDVFPFVDSEVQTIETPASLKYITESSMEQNGRVNGIGNKLVFSEKTYQCPYCDSSFFSILFLNRHKLVHQKEQQSDEPMLKPNLGLYMFKSIEKEEQKVDESTTEAKPSSVSVQVKSIEKEPIVINVNVPLSTTHLLHLKDKTIEVTHEEVFSSSSSHLQYELILRAFPSYSSLPESVIRAYLPILKQKKH